MNTLKILILRLKIHALYLQFQAHELERIWKERYSVPLSTEGQFPRDESYHLTNKPHTAAPILIRGKVK